MADEPFYAPNRKPPAPRQPRPAGDPLWEFFASHVLWTAELHNEAPHGWDCHLIRDGEFFASRRFDLREAAMAWANVQRVIERNWIDEA
jgi:hypothetical protein